MGAEFQNARPLFLQNMNFLVLIEGIFLLFNFLNMQSIMSIGPLLVGVDTQRPSKGNRMSANLPFDGHGVSTPSKKGSIDMIVCIFKKSNGPIDTIV